ncbi:MAG: hypothetical protein AMXMBFR44_5150 [Candidatus Campbellbacteria bacterium]
MFRHEMFNFFGNDRLIDEACKINSLALSAIAIALRAYTAKRCALKTPVRSSAGRSS